MDISSEKHAYSMTKLRFILEKSDENWIADAEKRREAIYK